MDVPHASELLEAVTMAQLQLVSGVEPFVLFDNLLGNLLRLTRSEYGFVGETFRTVDGTPYLKTHAITNIAWDAETQAFYEEHAPQGLEFHNLDTLFGAVLRTEETVISNHPSQDPRRGGLPEGHPPLSAFVGLPLRVGERMIGMAGLANRPGGYDEALIARISPVIQTCANTIFALSAERARKRAEASLRAEEVKLRAILDGARDGIVTIDERGIVEQVNPAIERIFGYSPADLMGKSVALLMHAEEREEHDRYIRAYLETGNARIIGLGRSVVGRRRDGSDVPVELSISELHLDGRRLFTGIIRDVSERHAAEHRMRQLEDALERKQFGQIIGRSPPMRRLYSTIDEVSKGDWTVLVEGETGVGKELVARAIHASSGRRDGSFIAINCAGMSDSLLGSQLFGHRRGAFTGAIDNQIGMFEAANGGTLLLDEIGDISSTMQKHLLRALQEREIVRLGDASPRAIDVRVVVATHRDLQEEVRVGRFRANLLYRIRVARVRVPPLRERVDDIPLLADYFLARARIDAGKVVARIQPDAMARLQAYDWPGNVRELEAAINYAVIRCRKEALDASLLPPELLGSEERVEEVAPPADERLRILEALAAEGDNRSRAAKRLGISRATFYRRLKQLGIATANRPSTSS